MVAGESRRQRLSPTDASKVAIASLMYPPQLAWLPYNGRPPYPGYINNWDKITWINEQIEGINLAYNARFPPKFHTYGIRTYQRKNKDKYGHVTVQAIKTHRWEHWQGTDRARMLHLTHDRRFKMGIALNNYFFHSAP